MEQKEDTALQQIADKALTDSVVCLELWKPASYSDYVVSFNVENSTKYQQEETVEDLLHKIIEEHMSHASGFSLIST